MGTVLLKSGRLHLRFLRGCKGRSACLWTTQYVSILKSTPFWWASIPQPLKWPIPLLTRRSMRQRTRFWMLFYTYFPCFLRISIHILNSQTNLSSITYQLSLITYQLSAINYHLSTITYQLSTINYQLSLINYQLSLITYQVSLISVGGQAVLGRQIMQSTP